MTDEKEKRVKRGLVFWAVVAAILVILGFLTEKINDNPSKVGEINNHFKENFGWTIEQFIEWAYEVQPIKEHKRWKIWKDSRREVMDPNEAFHAAILNEVNDVNFIYPEYSYEWFFILPKELPEPVIKVLRSVTFSDVNDVLGKNISEILPYIEEPLIDICALEDDKIVSFEAIFVKLSSLANDKLNFSVETKPFILSDNPNVRGWILGRVVLYTPEGCKINVCQDRKGGER